MQLIVLSLVIFIMLLFSLGSYEALECILNSTNTITVDGSGKGNFTKIQDAINSVPLGNSEWIHIQIHPGVYHEKVDIPPNKGCIFLEGAGVNSTYIKWGDYGSSSTSATFNSHSENILVKDITIENIYKPIPVNGLPSVAVDISGDKSAFYNCAFIGLQDTLADRRGRHYFQNCYIEGAIDFIFGYGQSIYQGCELVLNVGTYYPGTTGAITAQGKYTDIYPGGFVFKDCKIHGVGKALLGRAWKEKSTVIFSHSDMADVVAPQGWDSWHGTGHESDLIFEEDNCVGPGADMSHRVSWEKKLTTADLFKYLNITFIDQEGWIAKLPNNSKL